MRDTGTVQKKYFIGFKYLKIKKHYNIKVKMQDPTT